MLTAPITFVSRHRVPGVLRPSLLAWLARRGLYTLKPSGPASGLGIAALPATLGGLPVGSPLALLLQGQPLETLWMQSLLADALAQGPVFVLAHEALLVDQWLQDPRLQQAYASGDLRVSLMAPGLAGGSRPPRIDAVMAELAEAGLGPDHLLLVLGSLRTHLGRSVGDFRRWTLQLARWSRARPRPVLLAFRHAGDVQEMLGPLRSVADAVQHVALLGSESQCPVLFLERWNAQDEPIFEARFGLRHDGATRQLVYDGSQARGPAQRLVEAPDEYTVICTRAALAGQRHVPAAWQVVEPDADLLAATTQSIAATVLLDAGTTLEQEAVLHLVHALRLAHGRALKIVVRETRDKLRANVEQALLYLGANAVIYREIGFARVVKLLDDMHDVTYTREIHSDFDTARGAFMPDAVRGYLPPQTFCCTVLAMLERTASSGLQHSFLRLTMQRHVAHLDAVRACIALRDGDVLTADQDALYVFMFACTGSDVDVALARLFSIAPVELFAEQASFEALADVRNCLIDLQEAAQAGLPDYSASLTPRAPLAARVAPQPQAISTAPEVPLAVPAAAASAALPLQRLAVHSSPVGRRKPGAAHAD